MPKGYPGSTPLKPCEQCASMFKYKPSVEQRGHAKFCSVECQKLWQSESKSGKRPYVFTEKTLKKMSEAKLGKPNPTKGIPRPHLRGVNSPRWKGGARNVRDAAKGSLEYKSWRTAVFDRDNYTCQICEQYGGVLHADHKIRWADNEELRYNVDNGRTLCVACHYYVTFKTKMKPGTRWCNFTARKIG